MKETGVSRRIDELGRIVIPKEIRKNLKIREGDQMEFYVDICAFFDFRILSSLMFPSKIFRKM